MSKAIAIGSDVFSAISVNGVKAAVSCHDFDGMCMVDDCAVCNFDEKEGVACGVSTFDVGSGCAEAVGSSREKTAKAVPDLSSLVATSQA